MIDNLSVSVQPKVLLVSFATNWDSLSEIPHLFKEANCIVDVFCDERSWAKANKFFSKWIACKADENHFAEQLQQFVAANGNTYDWIILGDDPLINLMNDCLLDEAIATKILPITKLENRMILGSKIGLSKFCSTNNILTPAYHIYTNNTKSLQAFYQKEGFPLLTKEDRGFGGSGVRLCNNVEELKLFLEAIPLGSPVLIQKYLGNKAIGVEALYKNGQLIMHNCSKTLVNMTNEFSITTKRNFFENATIEVALTNLGEKMGLNGFINGTYIHHEESNTYHLIEVDARPNSWMAYGKFIGNDFTLGIKQFFSSQPSIINAPNINSTKEVVLFNKDIKRCILNRDFLGLFKWIVNYKGYWQYIPFYDKILLKRIYGEIVKLIKKRYVLPILKSLYPTRYKG